MTRESSKIEIPAASASVAKVWRRWYGPRRSIPAASSASYHSRAMAKFREERRANLREERAGWRSSRPTVAAGVWATIGGGWSQVVAAFAFGVGATTLAFGWMLGFDAHSLRWAWGSGTNQNRTDQDAKAGATTQQANVNLPISILSWGSNGGAVSQGNQADTKAYADNDNGTDQSVDQNQDANVAGSRGTSDDGPRCWTIAQSQDAANERQRDEPARDAYVSTKQVNVNAPISILSWGANGGDVRQHNDGATTAGATNTNATKQSIDQGHRPRPPGVRVRGTTVAPSTSRRTTNGNETNQHGDADASTKQVNVNAPISILSWGANGGAVSQGNQADTKAFAKNVNTTDQGVDQYQRVQAGGAGHGSGAIDQDQSAANDNRTDQSADAKSTTEQKNVNAALALLVLGGHASESGCGCSKSHDAMVSIRRTRPRRPRTRPTSMRPGRTSDSSRTPRSRRHACTMDTTVTTRSRVVAKARTTRSRADATAPTARSRAAATTTRARCSCTRVTPSRRRRRARTATNDAAVRRRRDHEAEERERTVLVPRWQRRQEQLRVPRAGDGSDRKGGVAEHNGANTTAGSRTATGPASRSTRVRRR